MRLSKHRKIITGLIETALGIALTCAPVDIDSESARFQPCRFPCDSVRAAQLARQLHKNLILWCCSVRPGQYACRTSKATVC